MENKIGCFNDHGVLYTVISATIKQTGAQSSTTSNVNRFRQRRLEVARASAAAATTYDNDLSYQETVDDNRFRQLHTVATYRRIELCDKRPSTNEAAHAARTTADESAELRRHDGGGCGGVQQQQQQLQLPAIRPSDDDNGRSSCCCCCSLTAPSRRTADRGDDDDGQCVVDVADQNRLPVTTASSSVALTCCSITCNRSSRRLRLKNGDQSEITLLLLIIIIEKEAQYNIHTAPITRSNAIFSEPAGRWWLYRVVPKKPHRDSFLAIMSICLTIQS